MELLHHSTDSATRQLLLNAALKIFAERGYAATSVNEIVTAARVSKPVLYYYFADKADLFQALVDRAHDERLRLMQKAAVRGATVAEKLEDVVSAMFEFSHENVELMRLAFATAFASPGEAPGHAKCREKGRRNYEFVKALIEKGMKAGELATQFTADEMAMSIYGQLNSYAMLRVLCPEIPVNRQSARQIVKLYLSGASARPKTGSQIKANGHPLARVRRAAKHHSRS